MLLRNLEGHQDKIETIGAMPPAPKRVVASLLEKSLTGAGLELEETVEVLNASCHPGGRALIEDFSAGLSRPRAADILLLPPLYFSSICENRCLYCDFSSRGTRLSRREFLAEMNALLDMGYRSIELVSGQDPGLFSRTKAYRPEDQHFDVGRVASYFRLAKDRLDARGGGMLTSNIPPIDRESLAGLKAAGLDCFLLWVETFDPEQYRRLHPNGGPKSDQAFRLRSYAEAREAGVAHLAGAFLKGLYDWRKEEAFLYLLDRDLRRAYGRGFSIIGTPRLKGPFQKTKVVRPYAVSDADYELNIALDRILFDGVLWLQTRETPVLNKHLIDRYGAGLILTLDCSTAPGGYSKASQRKAQFPVHRQNLARAVAELEDRGYNVIFDWTAETLSGFQRTRRTDGQG
jgi:2-iminoacetate synthase